jgi:hypothetical protein
LNKPSGFICISEPEKIKQITIARLKPINLIKAKFLSIKNHSSFSSELMLFDDILTLPFTFLNFSFSYFTNNLSTPTLESLFCSKLNPNFLPNLSYNK